MTENEQFELIELEEFGLCIQDNDSGVLYYMNDRTSFATLCILLNEQEEHIKLLNHGFDNDLKLLHKECVECEKKYDARIKELEESIQKISEKTREFKEHIESEIQFADSNIEKDERWKIHKNCYEQVLKEMPILLVWEGDVE